MSYQDIYPAEVAELLQKEQPLIIDQRDPEARSKGQMADAQSASEEIINALVRQRRQDPAVLVYCYHGNQSRELCGFLGQLGLTRVYNLVGGWEAWENWQQQATSELTPGLTPVLTTAQKNWLLSHGLDPADLNSRAELGMSPLMLAALKGEHELVETLLELGADVKAVNDDEHHALWFACVNGDLQLVQRLISAGSNLDNRNVNGVTCAIYAASTGKLDVLKNLVESGADLSITTHDGVSVLESAATLPVLRYLRPLVREAG